MVYITKFLYALKTMNTYDVIELTYTDCVRVRIHKFNTTYFVSLPYGSGSVTLPITTTPVIDGEYVEFGAYRLGFYEIEYSEMNVIKN